MAASREKIQRPASPPEVLTIADLAGYLQVSKSSLYKLVQQGRVPGQKVGKHWRFSRAAIDGWLVGSDQGRSRRSPQVS
jgi:excisionase family DNA binding protein